MHSFVAASSKLVKIGSLQECFDFAKGLIKKKRTRIVKIFKARPQEGKARIIFEVTREGTRNTPHGRVVDLKTLTREQKRGLEKKK